MGKFAVVVVAVVDVLVNCVSGKRPVIGPDFKGGLIGCTVGLNVGIVSHMRRHARPRSVILKGGLTKIISSDDLGTDRE